MIKKNCSKLILTLSITIILILTFTTFQVKASDEEILSLDKGGQLVESAGNLPDWPEEGWDGANDGDLETWNGTVTVFNQPEEGDEHPWAIFAFKDESTQLIDSIGIFPLTKADIDDNCNTRCVKDFQLHVSTKGTAESDFDMVLEDTVETDINLPFEEQEWKEFTFSPVDAKYVKLILLTNYGDSTYTTLGEFEVYSADTVTSVSSSAKLSTVWAKLKN